MGLVLVYLLFNTMLSAATVGTRCAQPSRLAGGPAITRDVTHYYWPYCGLTL